VTQIRDGVGIDRDLGTARSGIKYDFEVVVPGTHFGVEILAENMDDWELGFLLVILRIWEQGGLPIGGKSTRGPGWGKLQGLTLRRVEASTLLDYLTEGTMSEADGERFVQAFRDKGSAT